MFRIAAIALALAGLATPAFAQPQRLASRITAVEVRSVGADKTYGGVAYVKIAGTVRGVADPREAVVNIGALPKNAQGMVEYASNFEIIAPAQGQPANEVVYVDAENRGSAISQGALGGFLQAHQTSYARVQWQTGISAGVPANAQGLGLVILRDFGRWIAGRSNVPSVTGGFVPPGHPKLILGGISQSAWTVNTLIAEGFNVDPVTNRGVYDAAIAVDGVGNWLAINQLAAARNVAQTPYVEPNGPPLMRTELLKRPASDPLYVDIANYTDFYRLRAGLTSTGYSSPKFRRYDFPSPHAVANARSAARCNNGEAVGINTLRYAPYMRAIVVGMEKAIGVRAAQGAKDLPPSAPFVLTGSPPPSPGFNPLPGHYVRVPLIDSGWPRGGVRFPEVTAKLGAAMPVAMSPAVTTSISETCGNFGEFTPRPLTGLYRSKEAWLKAYSDQVDRLITQGFLLPEDKAAMVEAAARSWPAS